MILYRWQGRAPNFGDELNTILWPRLLPRFFDSDPAAHFLGIGSVLDQRHRKNGLKLVAGSGYGGYDRPPLLDNTWLIHWVRGPRTARLLGLPEALGLGDPAVLLPCVGEGPGPPGTEIGFMPHFESATHGAWQRAASMEGILLIDPRDEPLAVIAAIRRCRVLLSEALHGVIVADALRVPWVAIEPLAKIHRAKWHDWADTLGLTIAFQRLPPSSLLERARISGLASYHAGRTLLDRHGAHLSGLAADRFVRHAAEALRMAAAAAPQLSAAEALARCQAEMLNRVAWLRGYPMAGVIAAAKHGEPRRSYLRRRSDSAYLPGLIG